FLFDLKIMSYFVVIIRYFFSLRLAVLRFFFLALCFTRSGSFALPVSRFHSSYVSGVISPFTRSSANFLRCALLLNGICYPI
ncbi:hypothetical protein L0152_15230, partial [bacterium]|nr:hypothetical protein [bacterium]